VVIECILEKGTITLYPSIQGSKTSLDGPNRLGQIKEKILAFVDEIIDD